MFDALVCSSVDNFAKEHELLGLQKQVLCIRVKSWNKPRPFFRFKSNNLCPMPNCGNIFLDDSLRALPGTGEPDGTR